MASLITSPIWRDTYYMSTALSVNYRIELDGETIFSGKAVRYPDADYVGVNINKICRNYLESDVAPILSAMPATTMTLNQPEAMRTFNFYDGDTNPYNYRFLLDYSYQSISHGTGEYNASAPINGHFTPGMVKLMTVYYMDTGTSTTNTFGIVATTDTGMGYNTIVKCPQYALYYLNAYGGWDSFLIEGNVVKKDAISSFQTDRSYDNTTLQFETAKYVNEIKTSYELNTSLLSDDESDRLARHLISSVKVYMHNMNEGWIKPVIITDNSVTYQTYTNNGMKFSQYKINVTESQSKLRR